jgi:predicted transcriptional regulator
MPTTATSLKLPQRLKSRVERVAKRSRESSHAFMVRAIEEQVRSEELHQQFLADAERADAAMQKSGTGYAARDAHAYLEARVAGRRARRPRLLRWRK